MVQVVRGFGALYFSCPVSTQQANTLTAQATKWANTSCAHLAGCVLLVGFVGCEIRLCAFVRPRVPCVSCVSRLPPVSFYRSCECLRTYNHASIHACAHAPWCAT